MSTAAFADPMVLALDGTDAPATSTGAQGLAAAEFSAATFDGGSSFTVNGNVGIITQESGANVAMVDQTGGQNLAMVIQSQNDNATAVIFQIGDTNRAFVNQH
jgi:hypothetical protein